MHHIVIIGEGTLYHHALVAVLQKELEALPVSISLANNPSISCLSAYAENSKLLLLFELHANSTDSREQVKKICSQHPHALCMVILENASRTTLQLCSTMGIKGYLHKDCAVVELTSAIKQMFLEECYCSGKILQHIALNDCTVLSTTRHRLTQRELEILQLICAAFSSEQIAQKLFLSKRTVEWHRTNLLSKTGCKNSAGLVTYAWQLQNMGQGEHQSR